MRFRRSGNRLQGIGSGDGIHRGIASGMRSQCAPMPLPRHGKRLVARRLLGGIRTAYLPTLRVSRLRVRDRRPDDAKRHRMEVCVAWSRSRDGERHENTNKRTAPRLRPESPLWLRVCQLSLFSAFVRNLFDLLNPLHHIRTSHAIRLTAPVPIAGE